MLRRAATRPSAVLLAAGVVVGCAAVLPSAYLLLKAVEPGLSEAAGHLFRERTLDLLLNSVALTVAVTAACMVIGVLAAWLVVRSDLPFRRTFGVLFTVPLAIPSYVGGFTWISEWPGLAGFPGAFLVLTLVSYPYVFLPVAAALRSTDPALEEVSRSLGKSPRQTFLQVTLRQSRPAALAGGLLVALYVLSDFGAVSLMRFEAFTLGIYNSYRASFDPTAAAVLGCALVLLAVVITVGERRARGRAAAYRVGGGAARRAVPVSLGVWRIPALAAALGLVAAALGVPVVSLLGWLTGKSAGVDPSALLSATASTLEVSALGAGLAVLMAIPVGVLVARHASPLARGVELASYVGHALPGITVGLAIVFLGIRTLPGLYQELPMLVFGYAVLFLPLAVGAVRTGLAAAPVRLDEVARSLGKGRLETRLRVTFPLAAPGIAAGAALVFLTCAKELPATLLLRPTGTETLATELWTNTDVGDFGAAAPYAAVLIVVAAIPAVLLTRMRGGDA